MGNLNIDKIENNEDKENKENTENNDNQTPLKIKLDKEFNSSSTKISPSPNKEI